MIDLVTTHSFHLAQLKPLIVLPQDIKWEDLVAKYEKGVESHAGEPSLWEMPDVMLEKEIREERIDLLIYEAEKRRRQNI